MLQMLIILLSGMPLFAPVAVDTQEDEIWVATSNDVSRGERIK